MSASGAIIEGVIGTGSEALSPDAARYLLSLRFSEQQKDRFDELSQKARDGSLTPTERDELDEFLRTETLLIVLKAKARRTLSTGSQPAA
jgi:hypothetical protein